jgi:hypothetical protein
LQFDGDFLGDETQLRGRFEKDLAAGVDWQLVVAPGDWAIVGSSNRSAAELLPSGSMFNSRASAYLLRKAGGLAGEGSKDASRSVVVLAVVGLLIFVAQIYAAYYLSTESKRQFEEIVSVADNEQALFLSMRPWYNKPALADWGMRCVDEMVQNLFDFGSWDVVTVDCDPKTRQVSVLRQRQSGALLDDLLRGQSASTVPSGTVEPAQSTESLSVAMKIAARLPVAPSELISISEWRLQASRWSEMWAGKRPIFTQSAGGGVNQLSWSFTDDIPPWDVIEMLDIPGTVLDSVSVTSSAGGKSVWTIKAIHYAKN